MGTYRFAPLSRTYTAPLLAVITARATDDRETFERQAERFKRLMARDPYKAFLTCTVVAAAGLSLVLETSDGLGSGALAAIYEYGDDLDTAPLEISAAATATAMQLARGGCPTPPFDDPVDAGQAAMALGQLSWGTVLYLSLDADPLGVLASLEDRLQHMLNGTPAPGVVRTRACTARIIPSQARAGMGGS